MDSFRPLNLFKEKRLDESDFDAMKEIENDVLGLSNSHVDDSLKELNPSTLTYRSQIDSSRPLNVIRENDED